jgi:hypothetical protein
MADNLIETALNYINLKDDKTVAAHRNSVATNPEKYTTPKLPSLSDITKFIPDLARLNNCLTPTSEPSLVNRICLIQTVTTGLIATNNFNDLINIYLTSFHTKSLTPNVHKEAYYNLVAGAGAEAATIVALSSKLIDGYSLPSEFSKLTDLMKRASQAAHMIFNHVLSTQIADHKEFVPAQEEAFHAARLVASEIIDPKYVKSEPFLNILI